MHTAKHIVSVGNTIGAQLNENVSYQAFKKFDMKRESYITICHGNHIGQNIVYMTSIVQFRYFDYSFDIIIP